MLGFAENSSRDKIQSNIIGRYFGQGSTYSVLPGIPPGARGNQLSSKYLLPGVNMLRFVFDALPSPKKQIH